MVLTRRDMVRQFCKVGYGVEECAVLAHSRSVSADADVVLKDSHFDSNNEARWCVVHMCDAHRSGSR